MSAYIEAETQITSRQALVDALVEIGFRREHIEVHESPVLLVGWKREDNIEEGAHIIVRKETLGRHYGRRRIADLGFRQTDSGAFAVLIDDYATKPDAKGYLDQHFNCAGGFVNEVRARAAVIAAEHRARARGLRTTRRIDGRKIILEVRA